MAGDDLTLAPSRAHRRRLDGAWQRRGNGPTSYSVHRRRGRLRRPRSGRISVRVGERLEIGPSGARARGAASRTVSSGELGDKVGRARRRRANENGVAVGDNANSGRASPVHNEGSIRRRVQQADRAETRMVDPGDVKLAKNPAYRSAEETPANARVSIWPCITSASRAFPTRAAIREAP
jgi:hypothetical protein